MIGPGDFCCEGCTAPSHDEPLHCTVCWPADEPSPPTVADLMAALEASLAEARRTRWIGPDFWPAS